MSWHQIDLDQLVEDMNSLQKKCPSCPRLEVCMGASAKVASASNLTLGEQFHQWHLQHMRNIRSKRFRYLHVFTNYKYRTIMENIYSKPQKNVF